MKQISISKAVIEAYKGTSVDISYALSELIGMVSYNKSTQISIPPVRIVDAVPYEIGDDVYEALEDKFDSLEDISSIAEVLLWNNYFMGVKL